MDNKNFQDIDTYLRAALNVAFVELAQTQTAIPTRRECTDLLRQRLLYGIKPDPNCWQHDADKFPFVQGSMGEIGDTLESEPYNYKRVGH